MRKLIGKERLTEKVSFMGDTVEIMSLSINEIRKFQNFVKQAQKDESEDAGLDIQRQLIRMAVVDAGDLTDDELDSFPIKALAKLAKDILVHNGLDPDAAGEVGNAT
jgi:hypothetical protein